MPLNEASVGCHRKMRRVCLSPFPPSIPGRHSTDGTYRLCSLSPRIVRSIPTLGCSREPLATLDVIPCHAHPLGIALSHGVLG